MTAARQQSLTEGPAWKALAAPCERAVFTQGVIWNLDSFGQPGKVPAGRILPELESETEPALSHDSSTNNLVRRYRKPKGSSVRREGHGYQNWH